MLLALGGACAACRATSSLEFDCIVPMGHGHHRGSAPERISFYRKQMLAGNVQILCSHCNGIKSDLSMDTWLAMVSRLRQWEASLRLASSSGRGTRLTPEERVEYLRDLRAIFPSA
jgi:5-methylcytosine-specific restriction endonuclease McrA